MMLTELIEKAKEAAGSYGQLAEKLDCHQNRITDWKKGTRQPDAGKIACMAEIANLPILETVAEIEAQLDERYAQIWRDALGKLKAAGVAASVSLILQGTLPSEKAYANQTANDISPAKQEYTLWQV
jgi:transcriptional regulator with XRE-family HTH domain